MLVTPLGIETVVNAEQPEKAYCPMAVTPSPIVKSVNEEQFLKAEDPMLVTPLGIETVVNAEQPEKAYCPMAVTPSPIVKSVNEEQFLKA